MREQNRWFARSFRGVNDRHRHTTGHHDLLSVPVRTRIRSLKFKPPLFYARRLTLLLIISLALFPRAEVVECRCYGVLSNRVCNYKTPAMPLPTHVQ